MNKHLKNIIFGAAAVLIAAALLLCSVFATPSFDFGLAMLAVSVGCGGVLLLSPLFTK